MVEVLLSLAGAYALFILTWVAYLAIMQLSAQRERLHPVVKFHAYFIVLPIGFFLDALLNLLVCFIFMRIPRDWLLTGTLKRTINLEEGWRVGVAAWICSHTLDQFDPSGDHC